MASFLEQLEADLDKSAAIMEAKLNSLTEKIIDEMTRQNIDIRRMINEHGRLDSRTASEEEHDSEADIKNGTPEAELDGSIGSLEKYSDDDQDLPMDDDDDNRYESPEEREDEDIDDPSDGQGDDDYQDDESYDEPKDEDMDDLPCEQKPENPALQSREAFTWTEDEIRLIASEYGTPVSFFRTWMIKEGDMASAKMILKIMLERKKESGGREGPLNN